VQDLPQRLALRRIGASMIICWRPLPSAISPGHCSITKRRSSRRVSSNQPSSTCPAATASQWPNDVGELNWHGQAGLQLQFPYSTPRIIQRSAMHELRQRSMQHNAQVAGSSALVLRA
jgi:hypothetical protein